MLSKRQSKVEGDLEKGGIIIQYDVTITQYSAMSITKSNFNIYGRQI